MSSIDSSVQCSIQISGGKENESMVFKNVSTAYRLLSVVLAAFAVIACVSLRVGSDYDHSANFAGYHTFSWMPREHHGTRNPFVIRRAQDAIQTELIGKGYSFAGDGAAAPDFVVDFTIGSRERVDIQSYPIAYRGPWGWGYPYFGNDINVHQYREGTLSIDVFDARTRQPVWHGWAKKELTRKDLEQSEGPIRAAVAAVVQRFPPM
jgi:hypothetical protein